jgi:Txe/YoeB family toxin of Txe-Axe toxin-antitoxin module
MSRMLVWIDEAWADYLYWQGQDKKTLKRINKFITDAQYSPHRNLNVRNAITPALDMINSNGMYLAFRKRQ